MFIVPHFSVFFNHFYSVGDQRRKTEPTQEIKAMNIYEIKEITPQRLLEVWEDSVRATRHFLSDA